MELEGQYCEQEQRSDTKADFLLPLHPVAEQD
jgi:hypothetical protein